MKPSWPPLAELSSSPQKKKKKSFKPPLDPTDMSAAGSTGRKKQKRLFNKKPRDRHKRLHLRKSAAQPPAMQSEDKRGPKKIAGQWEHGKVWPSAERNPQGAQQGRHGTNDGENMLRFPCSRCTGNSEYAPKDLVRHFEETHGGSPPVFSCHTCAYSTHALSFLQIHLLSHKDTFSSCGFCRDDVKRTWPEFSAHLTMRHCRNGKYLCELCPRFSTGDVGGFLQHMSEHDVGPGGTNDGLLLHIKDEKTFGPPPTTLHCQHCGYEASQKWLVTEHIKVAHVCQNGRNRVRSTAMKPNDPIPKMKARLTRSAVREMCWLTQDCLSLPGREFLDKYCHLSDPQTTLEQTRQFLMKSVAGETGDQKWTKALKTVFSNVPQEVNLHPKSENGLISNSSDLTVLTVKKKITVANNGYSKRLRRRAASDKETVLPESAAVEAHQNGSLSLSDNSTSCPQTETKLHNDVLPSAQRETTHCTQMQENRENRELQTDREIGERGQKQQEPPQDGVISISSELKLANEGAEQKSSREVRPQTQRTSRRSRRTASRKVKKRSTGLPLKMVLRKNPVKEKQWVSQSSLPTSERRFPPTAGVPQGDFAKVSDGDPSDPVASVDPGDPLVPFCAAQPTGLGHLESGEPGVPSGTPGVNRQEMKSDASKCLQSPATCEDRSQKTSSRDVTDVEMYLSNGPLRQSGSDAEQEVQSAADRVSTQGGSTPFSQPIITPQGEVNQEDQSLALYPQQSDPSGAGTREDQEYAVPCPDLPRSTHSPPAAKALRRGEPSTAPVVPKKQERTLKLVAIDPCQPVKRPVGDQPVVVLNHPDADIPEVARIMKVVSRYRGDVRKVMLSRRTLNALAVAAAGEVPGHAAPWVRSSVQERFILKLKLRRLSRKKYEVVGADSPGSDPAAEFRCWFCGRVFASQETWMVHRQRHLLEWKRPHCEKS